VEIISLIKTLALYALIAFAILMAYESLKLISGESIEKIEVVIKFVKEYNLGTKVLFGAVGTLAVGTGLVGLRGNRQVRRIANLRSRLEVKDPEKTSSGLNRKGRSKK